MRLMNNRMRLMNNRAPFMRRRTVVGGVVFLAGRRAFAREALSGAGKRDDAGEDRAQQRQEDDCLIHRSLSALHQVNVFNGDAAAVAIERDENGKPDRRLGRRNCEDQEGVDLADDVTEMAREGDQVDVDRQQDQFNRHQDDDDVLAIEEDAEDSEREQDGANREIMSQPDGHTLLPRPSPDRTFNTSIDITGVRAFCVGMCWRFTRSLCRSVSTMAPTIATSRTRPAASKK